MIRLKNLERFLRRRRLNGQDIFARSNWQEILMAAHTDAGAPQPTTVLLESTIQQTSKQVAADMGGGEIAMMSVNTGKYYHLNETSARIWQLIETPCRVSDICAALQADYDVDMAECEHEVLSHLSCLVNAGMAETVAKAA